MPRPVLRPRGVRGQLPLPPSGARGAARHAIAAARSDIPGRFQELERWLYLLPKQAQFEFNQLINNYSQALANLKRKIREPWRR